MFINGKPYPTLTANSGSGRLTVTIDEQGTVTVHDPTLKEPKEEKPKTKE